MALEGNIKRTGTLHLPCMTFRMAIAHKAQLCDRSAAPEK